MCAIIGALFSNVDASTRNAVQNVLQEIWHYSHARGRDGRGWQMVTANSILGDRDTSRIMDEQVAPLYLQAYRADYCQVGSFIANLRAEPTTEYVVSKTDFDQQPYKLGKWNVVHNGTIANDKELRTHHYPSSIDSAAIIEQLNAQVPLTVKVDRLGFNFAHFKNVIRKLKGSYAIIASHDDEPNKLYVACNYRPIWYVHTDTGIYFASSRDYLPGGYGKQMVTPYTVSVFELRDGQAISSSLPLLEQPEPRRALVVCSGGLDSVVAATIAQRRLGFDEVQLIHFLYGSRAEGPEVEAVKRCAEALGVEAIVFRLPVYQPEDSPLLRPDAGIAGGEAGAEFAHEWVPARNLVMLSVATAYAEANKFDTVVLGNNLEEAGAYPDNEPEFIARFNDLLPFAVADGKQVQVIMPVGNLMKHEIVAVGHELGAPLAHTWSCYRAGEKHCGTCGPCYMRRKAFEINTIPEVIEYVSG